MTHTILESPLPGVLAPPVAALEPLPQPPFAFSILWLLQNGSPSLQHRALVDVAGLSGKSSVTSLTAVPYATVQGVQLAMTQLPTGMWSGGMLAVPQRNGLDGVGTVPAYRRLLELGWDPDSPTMTATRRLLFRLLQEDEDPSYLAEMAEGATDEFLVRRGRQLLREAAAAALAQAGYELDPRLRGAAKRMMDRLGAFLKSPLSQKPWIRIGNQHVLPAEVAAPSFHLLVMLAHMPHFRSEHHETVDRLYSYISQPWPRQTAVQQVGPHIIEQPHLVLGDFLPTRNAMDADMPSALAWLELMARLGFLRRNEGWQRLIDRLEDDRARNGVWHAPRSVAEPATVPAWSWPTMPLGDRPARIAGDGPSDAAASMDADVTFRLGLIARLSGREIVLG